MRVVSSSSAAARLRAARSFVTGFPTDTEVLLVAATRGAADDFARELGRGRATFGLHRFSFMELAARAAMFQALGRQTPAGTDINAEALAARVAFEAASRGELAYYAPVAATPGFPRALARTIHEVRLAGGGAMAAADPLRDDLKTLLSRIEAELDAASATDRAGVYFAATEGWRRGLRWFGRPVLLLDVPLDSLAERGFGRAVIAAAAGALVTCPAGDEGVRETFEAGAYEWEEIEDDRPEGTDLGRLRRSIFRFDPSPARTRAGDVRLFSAPGESREAIEIARRILDEAASGVRFDDIAVCLRAPQQYVGLLEHAFARARVPAYFDRGTRRPDPAGRAFVALVSCACENLSAKRFDEYLSLGQVPRVDQRRGDATPGVPDDEMYARFARDRQAEPDHDGADEPEIDADDQAIVAGALRAPWKWEELVVEAAVIGGVDREAGRARWRHRLDGLAAEYRVRLAELGRDEPESPRIARLERDQRNLEHLRAFALPIVDTLAGWPERAIWGEWLEQLSALAPVVLRRPARVLRTLAELAPLASVGPVTLEEVRDVLQPKLLTLDWDAPADRYGRVLVGTPHQLRGRAFAVVFVPGLAERIFPQRVREDPLLPDAVREQISGALLTRPNRTAAERLLLRLAIGAATERLYVSYPRLGADLGDMRPRVPSFYALDIMRAVTGVTPDHRVLAAEAAEEADASLAWPAPRDPARAIDDFEHDLAVLKPLFEARDGAAVKGQAHYLLELNDALRRSVIRRWARARPRWSTSDGLIQASPGVKRALEHHRLGRRAYSLSALQRFATCPYQFLLAAIHRIQPWEEPQPIVRMDPLTRGSLFHRVQAEFFRALHADGRLPVTAGSVRDATATLQLVVDRVAAEYADQLAPAIDRVWRDEIDELRRDLTIWVQRLADDAEWIPEFFEYSFGLADQGRDPRSLETPVTLDGGFILRGSVDLIERRHEGASLRVTDHKTGRNRATRDLVIGGGTVLQPVLYSLAVERAMGTPVEVGRLYYCTTAGGFADHAIRIDADARRQGLQALTIIDRAVELGRLPAAPLKDACTWCDFRAICGPDEEQRVAHKPDDVIADLLALREVR